MNLQDKFSFSSDDEVVNMPLTTYCSKCDVLLVKGRTARMFNKATYYHEVCPNLPLRQFALSRIPAPGTYTYPATIRIS